MAPEIRPEVQAIIDRCAAIDWRKPSHDPGRAIAAYKRRLAAAGLQRQVRWIDDPREADTIDVAIGRAVKAWKSGIAPFAPPHLAPFLGEAPTAGHGTAIDDTRRWRSNWAPSPYRAQQDFQHVEAGNAAKRAWEDSIGWAAVDRHYGGPLREAAAAWDRSMTQIVTAYANEHIDAIAASDLAGNPWEIPVKWPFPLAYGMLAASMATHGALSAPRYWTTCASHVIWDSTTAHDAGHAVACLNLPVRDSETERLLAIYEPMIEAHEAGAFAHCLLDWQLIILAAPAIWLATPSPQSFMTRRQLSRPGGGPVLEWPHTKAYEFHGHLLRELPSAESQSGISGMMWWLWLQRKRNAANR